MTADAMLRLILDQPRLRRGANDPLDHARRLSARLGHDVLLKREDQQPIFTLQAARGIQPDRPPLPRPIAARGVITASAGNHAQGVAFAARHLELSALIVMPQTTPAIKVEAVRELGADVDAFGRQLQRRARPGATSSRVERPRLRSRVRRSHYVIAGQGRSPSRSWATSAARWTRSSCLWAAAV